MFSGGASHPSESQKMDGAAGGDQEPHPPPAQGQDDEADPAAEGDTGGAEPGSTEDEPAGAAGEVVESMQEDPGQNGR